MASLNAASSTTLPASSSKLVTRLQRAWNWLIQPSQALPLDEQLKARMLIIMLLIAFIFNAVAGVAYNLMPRNDPTPGVSWYSGSAVLLMIYISRTRYYKIAALMFVGISHAYVIGVYLTVSGNIFQSTLVVLIFGVIVASLLLSALSTVLWGMFTVMVIMIIPVLAAPTEPAPNWMYAIITITSSLVLAASTALRERYLRQRRAAEAELRQQVIMAEEARAQAERSDRIKSAFLASMSHELRTPLNAIINFTMFVKEGDLGVVNDEQKDILGQVMQSGKHLLSLINDVLDMSKIEAGSLRLFIEDNIDLAVIAQEVVRIGQGLIGTKSLKLTADIPADLPRIRGDRQRITQVLLNMMSNACKFTEQGTIHLQLAHQGADVWISLKDTGPGIAPEDQPAVFEAFKQTTTGLRQGGGTGLGMPISKNLVEAHGGRIWVESAAGQGATFTVVLPVASAALVALQAV